MVVFIVLSLLVTVGAAALLIGLVIAWALAGSSEEHEQAINKRGKRRSVFSRLWKWANKDRPRLDYRRDKKGRFRKVKRW